MTNEPCGKFRVWWVQLLVFMAETWFFVLIWSVARQPSANVWMADARDHGTERRSHLNVQLLRPSSLAQALRLRLPAEASLRASRVSCWTCTERCKLTVALLAALSKAKNDTEVRKVVGTSGEGLLNR